MDVDREVAKIIDRIKKNVQNLEWECVCNGCHEKAINSHLLQRNGILNSITDNGHLMEVRTAHIFKWKKDNPPVEFKKVGINNALSQHIFCSQHDTDLFKSIEQNNIDLDSYKTFLLLSYRATCSELRKKEIAGKEFYRFKESRTLPMKLTDYAVQFLSQNEEARKELKFYNEQLINELKDVSNGNFTFYHFEYDLMDIYASSIVTMDGRQFIGNDEILHNLFIHIIPYNGKLHIITGYHNNYCNEELIDYVESWESLSVEELQRKLTHLFIFKIENWGLSVGLYKAIKQGKIEQFMDNLKGFNVDYETPRSAQFNLFE